MEMPKYNYPVSLIPGGCPQFLDYAFDLSAMDAKLLRFSRSFREEKRAGAENDNRQSFALRCVEENENGQWVDQVSEAPSGPSDYDLEARKCLEIYYDQWIPVPMLRLREQKRPDGEPMFEMGPSNWARLRITRPEEGSSILRLVLAFDTTVEEQPTEGEQYFALSPKDVAANATYNLAWHVRDNAWFINSPWVDEWLFSLHDNWMKAGKKRQESEFALEHLSEYLTLLEFLHRLLPEAKVKVINPSRDTPVDVDLILDIGNSRTTGILVETLPHRSTNLNDSYLLQIRDLSQPEKLYSEPFATLVEFSEAVFGNDALSRRSGRRTPAFTWASAVRMGPEASRLSTKSKCAEGTTGMSSPKRYLWDERPWKPTWRYNTGGGFEPMVTRGSFARQVNQEGTPLCCFDDPQISRNPIYRKQEAEVAFESQFTRSSLMLFLLGEVLMQALVTINSPAQRAKRELSDFPRRLRRVIFVVPSGMPIAEQRIYRRWVSFAVRTVWEALGWKEWYTAPRAKSTQQRADYRQSPETRCNWDEASCTQLVYLYNEITRKFQGDAHHFFRISGKERAGYGAYHSLRVASIDVGGGTTDLSVATFSLENDESSAARIRPHLELRDGFNIAGDDILKAVVADHILSAIGKAVAAHGATGNPHSFLNQLFGRDVLGNSQEKRNLRAQFIRQIAAPAGLALLAAYEVSDPLQGGPVSYRMGQFFTKPFDGTSQSDEEQVTLPFVQQPRPSDQVIGYLEEMVNKAGAGTTFSLMNVPVVMDPKAIEISIRSVMGRIVSDLCEVIHAYDCDALLLTGRPSRLKGLIDSVIAKLPVPPDRIIPMCDYRVGAWYPFADVLGNISDPKTTVSVGAILCALAEGHLEGFSFDTQRLKLASTARYIGEMNTNGQITAPKVWFEVDVSSGKEQELDRQVLMSGPLPVGFRQFGVERWPTTRFYIIDFANEDYRRQAAGKLPYKLSLRFTVKEVEEENPSSEQDEGELFIQDIEDNQGDQPRGGKNAVEVRLQTLPLDEGYWLDTGVVYNG